MHAYYYDLTWTPTAGGNLSQDTESNMVHLCDACAAQHRANIVWAGAGIDGVGCENCDDAPPAVTVELYDPDSGMPNGHTATIAPIDGARLGWQATTSSGLTGRYIAVEYRDDDLTQVAFGGFGLTIRADDWAQICEAVL